MAPVLLGALQDGAYMTTISKFDPEVFLTAIQKQKVTHFLKIFHRNGIENDNTHLSQLMRLWYLSHRRPAKSLARLRG